jgi:hypothetical protein
MYHLHYKFKDFLWHGGVDKGIDQLCSITRTLE